jgi:hypothetical protein
VTVSRFTTSILLATALLGVLVWIVLSMARDLARAPDEPLPLPTDEQEEVFDPTLPRLLSYQDMQAWLNSRGLPADKLLGFNRRWLEEKEFPVTNLPLIPPIELDPYNSEFKIDYSGLDDATLLNQAGVGDTYALHELGDRSIETDPLAALEWYDQAIVNGSLYAMVRTSDLLTTLSDPAINEFVADPVWQDALEQIRNAAPAPRERALAWSIALVTIGGYALMSSAHAQRIASLTAQLDAAGIDRACDTAQEYVLDTAGARRARQMAIFSLEAPPFALTIASPANAIPCDVPVPPLISLDHCEASDFVGPGSKLMTAWVCPL